MIVVWFSCGAASAVAAKLAVEKYGHQNVTIVNTPIKVVCSVITKTDGDPNQVYFDSRLLSINS